MRERSTKLPFSATRVLKASRELSLGEKIVWLEDHALDLGPEGAFLASGPFARRWGLSVSPATVEEYRRRLRAYGLHEQVPRPGARSVGWVATLPPQCVPRSSRPTDEEVEQLAALLDAHVRARAAPNQSRGRTTTGVVLSAQSSLGSDPNERRAMRGERGEPPSSESRRKATLQPQAGSEDGVGAHAPKAEDGEADTRSREEVEAEGWRRIQDARSKSQKPLSATERAAFERMIGKLPPERQAELRRKAYGL